MTNATFLSLAVLCVSWAPASSHQVSKPGATLSVAQDDARLAKLPVPLREKGRLILAEADEDTRADLAESLAEEDAIGALDFLLTLLDTDPSADVRENIVDELEQVDDPRVDPALARRVLVDADLDIALASLEILRARAASPLMRLLEERLSAERKEGRTEVIARLMAEQERWTTIVRGGLLPTFFQTPPALFSVKPAAQTVRVLAFGDFGDGSDPQKRVAGAMLRYHQQHPFDFGITLGDNFYPSGMFSPADPRWETWWSALYDPLKILFYPAFGNHDWNQPNGPAAEILFSQRSPSWRMPAAYYTFEAGPVQFFALDTDIISEAQLRWLGEELDKSRAVWKVVYGHHPIYSAGQHEDNDEKIAQLLPVLKDRADVYLAGHDHDMQHLKPEGRLHFFVAGTGGKLRTIEAGPRSLFAHSAHGFAVLEADARTLKVTFVQEDLTSPYAYTLTRPAAAAGRHFLP
ncbi:MAG: metallophosphoesterase [Vicinamibacterales bacterium]